MKLVLSGMVANTTYGLIVREVGANFVNPANHGFTMGGVTDRLSADLNRRPVLRDPATLAAVGKLAPFGAGVG